jgi:hypothetical protein
VQLLLISIILLIVVLCVLIVYTFFYKQNAIIFVSCFGLSGAVVVFITILIAVDNLHLSSPDVLEQSFIILLGFIYLCLIFHIILTLHLAFYYDPRTYLSTFSYVFGRIFYLFLNFIIVVMLLFLLYQISKYVDGMTEAINMCDVTLYFYEEDVYNFV